MSLSKTLYPLFSTGSTQEDKKCPNMIEELLTGMKSTNKQTQGHIREGQVTVKPFYRHSQILSSAILSVYVFW